MSLAICSFTCGCQGAVAAGNIYLGPDILHFLYFLLHIHWNRAVRFPITSPIAITAITKYLSDIRLSSHLYSGASIRFSLSGLLSGIKPPSVTSAKRCLNPALAEPVPPHQSQAAEAHFKGSPHLFMSISIERSAALRGCSSFKMISRMM